MKIIHFIRKKKKANKKEDEVEEEKIVMSIHMSDFSDE